MVYKTINIIKFLKGSRAPRDCTSNIMIRKKRREPCSRKLEKGRSKEEIISFPKPKNIEDLVRCSVR